MPKKPEPNRNTPDSTLLNLLLPSYAVYVAQIVQTTEIFTETYKVVMQPFFVFYHT